MKGNVVATDLRTLRIVSYFLRDSGAIKEEFERAAKFSSTSSTSSSVGIPEKDKKEAQQQHSLPIHIRNGSLIDTRGVIASSLLKMSS